MIKTKCYEMYNGNLLVSITCHCVYDLVTWRLETYFNLKICELERQKKKKDLTKIHQMHCLRKIRIIQLRIGVPTYVRMHQATHYVSCILLYVLQHKSFLKKEKKKPLGLMDFQFHVLIITAVCKNNSVLQMWLSSREINIVPFAR